MATNTASIKDFVQDDHNLNKGNDKGAMLINKSLAKFGAGRSILVDKNGRIIAGNKTQEAAINAGLEEAIVVETNGDKLVVVKRTDIDIDSSTGRELALADNATSKENLTWDEVELPRIADAYGIDMRDWGFNIKEATEPVSEEGKDNYHKLGLDLATEMEEPIKAALDMAIKHPAFKTEDFGDNTNKNGNAIYLIVKQWAEQKKS